MITNNIHNTYIYLVNIETLDVVRFNPNATYDNELYVKGTKEDQYIKGETKILRHLNNGYLRTRPEIYRRFTSGLLTENSFTKVERPKGSGKYVTANIYK